MIIYDYMICMCYNVVELHIVNCCSLDQPNDQLLGQRKIPPYGCNQPRDPQMLGWPYRSVSERMRLAILQNNINTEKKGVPQVMKVKAYSYHSLTTSINIYHIKP